KMHQSNEPLHQDLVLVPRAVSLPLLYSNAAYGAHTLRQLTRTTSMVSMRERHVSYISNACCTLTPHAAHSVVSTEPLRLASKGEREVHGWTFSDCAVPE